jgi:hypothetical protein
MVGTMKRILKAHLRANPKAKKHEKVIKETIKALNTLKDTGFGNTGYRLGSAYGGTKAPQGTTRREMPSNKMTYCA